MGFPSGVRTRLITVGSVYNSVNSDSTLEKTLRVVVSSNRALIWNGELIGKTVGNFSKKVSDGPLSFDAMVTDMSGMVDAETMQEIDVTDGKQTHLLTARIRVFEGFDLIGEYNKTFPLPTSTDPLDLDTLINPNAEDGVLLPEVGVSPEQIQTAVDAYMSANPAATPEYVGEVLDAHISATRPHPNAESGKDFAAWFTAQTI